MVECKTVRELSDDCLMFLKFALFYDGDAFDTSEINYYWQIPDEMVYSHYDGIQFVPDDFGEGVEW